MLYIIQIISSSQCISCEDAGRLQKEDQHEERCHEANHDAVELFPVERLAVPLHFIDDVVRRHNPAEQEGRQQCDEGHHHAVADVVHDVEQLADRAVRQLHFKVEDAVAEGDDG